MNYANYADGKVVENNFDALPESFGHLNSLEFFSLRGGKVKTLPDSFENLSALKTLYLRDLNLESLPKFLAALPLLEEMNIHDCTFTPSLQRRIDNGEFLPYYPLLE